jgi:hypothetical protein
LIRRWIGASRRRAARAEAEGAGGGAEIVRLTWAQTFGRPVAPEAMSAHDGPPYGAGQAVILKP